MKLGFYILMIVMPLQSFAQDKLLIRGTIRDVAKNPVSFGNAAVYNPADSTLVAGAVSNADGLFEVSVPPGTYYVRVTFISYEEKIIRGVVATDRDVDLGTIILKESTDILKEVVVQGEKEQMELQLDKRVFNVGQDLSNAGGNAADILGNLPSVSVSPDGAVSLRGSENVTIWINGKPSSLTSRDPDALRKLQGNLVERIEVITNPSSRYDAAGDVGIINIILKKDQRAGVNGAFTINAGHPAFYGGSYSINYRKNKTNLFSSYGLDYRRGPGKGSSYQRYSSSDTSFVYEQNSERSRGGLSHNFMAGLDYYFNDKNSITGSFTYNPSQSLNKASTLYRDLDENRALMSTSLRSEREEEDEENVEATVSFKRDFRLKGQTLTADVKWIKSEDNENTDYEQSSGTESPLLQRAINLANEENWLFQADYVHPFSKNGKVEAGIKSTTRIIKNDFGLEQQEGAEWNSLPAFTNNLVYTERIHAVYAMASNTFNKVSLQAGLRGELSDITTELTATNEINPREYFNLFPAVSASYALTEEKTLQASYSYRISRPNFRDLLPFSDFRDNRVYFVGNPNIKPEYTHSFEVGYLLNWESGSVLSSVYHRHRTDVIQRITEIDSAGVGRVIPVNLAKENAYGVEFNFSLNVQNWWRVNATANLYRAITEGRYQDELLESDTYTWTTRTTSRMTFFKKLDFQAALNYRAPRITPQGKDLSMYSIDLGLSKDVFKGKGTLSANVRDLLNTRKRRSIVDDEGYYSKSEFQWRARQFILTFTYRLNRAKERERPDNRNNGNEGEEY